MKLLIFTATLFCLVSCAFADPKNDLRCREIAFSQSVENKAIEAFKSFLDHDVRFVGKSVLTGPDEVSAAWQVFFSDDGPAIMWRPQFVEILEDERLALTRGPYRIISKDADGNTAEHWGTFNSVWRKNDDGEWRVVFDVGSESADPPSDEIRALLQQQDAC